jgi:hypothetical protein
MELSAAADGRENAIDLLPSLFSQMNDGRVVSLGLVVDADFKANGAGKHAAYTRVTAIAQQHGFLVPEPYPAGVTRFIFRHPDGLPDFGLWIMPDCSQDGMLEHLVEASVSANQASLFAKACNAVRAIAAPLFNVVTHTSRARVYTWLAWQRVPGRSVATTVSDDLIDLTKTPARECVEWLQTTFR